MPLTSSRTPPGDSDFERRFRGLNARMLDRVERELDLLTAPDPAALRRAAIVDAVWLRFAPLLCRLVRCRRARCCQRQPCVAPHPRGHKPPGDTAIPR